MQYIHRDTLRVTGDRTRVTLPDGRTSAVLLSRFSVPERVALRYYTLTRVSGETPGYAWDNDAGTCVQTFVEPVPDPRIELMRQNYRTANRGICMLAGVEPVDKLEDVDMLPVRQAALAADPVQTGALVDVLTYCLFQLYRLDGDDAWERI